MRHTNQTKMLKRAVTLTAAAIFCSIILFVGILTAFVRMHSRISGHNITMPYIEKNSQGQAVLHFFGKSAKFNVQTEYDKSDKRYALLFLYPDDSSLIISIFETLCE